MFKRGFKTWCERAAIDARKQNGLKSIDPFDLKILAGTLGAKIIYPENIKGLDSNALKILVQKDPESWSALTIKIKGAVIIILNSAHSSARQMSDLAHELSHLLIGHTPSQVKVSPNGLLLTTYDKQQEDEATWLAGCLLLPREACLHIYRKRMDSRVSTEQYGISKAMLLFRLRVTGTDRQINRWSQRTA